MFQAKYVEKIKTHTLCSVAFFLKSCRWRDTSKNMVEPEGPNIIRRLRVASWISKATRAQRHAHTHTQRNMQYLLLFHCSNYFINASQCYVIRTLPLVFLFATTMPQQPLGPIQPCIQSSLQKECGGTERVDNTNSDVPPQKMDENEVWNDKWQGKLNTLNKFPLMKKN